MTALPPRGAIVVGTDGSKHADLALDWAAEEAQRRHVRLHLIHATNLDWLVSATIISRAAEHAVTDDVLDAASRRVATQYPDLMLSAHVTTGAPAHDLVEASDGARLVVLGAHGRTVSHVPLGSVPHAVAMHASCPVVVVRGESPAPRTLVSPVVVGVDGSRSCASAIDFAFDQAAHRGARLTAVHGWWLELVDGLVVTTPGSREWQEASQRMQRQVCESLAGHRERYPDVEVDVRLVRARPAEALITASKEASLIVVGARGRGGFTGLLLGSVSREVLMHAAGPVAVVSMT